MLLGLARTAGEPPELEEYYSSEEILEVAPISESNKLSLLEKEPFETLMLDESKPFRSQLRE